MGRFRAFAVVFVVTAAACNVTPAFGTPAPEFIAWLDSYGQVFTPEVPPADAADWHPSLGHLPVPQGSQVESAIYGKVECVDPARNCANRGLARPGEPVAIWLITFREDPKIEGCRRWAVIDPATGQDTVAGGEEVCG